MFVHSCLYTLIFRHANKQEKDEIRESLQGIKKAKIQDPVAPQLSVENHLVAENRPVTDSSAGHTVRDCWLPTLSPNLSLNLQPAAPIASAHSLSAALATQIATLKQQLGLP